MPVWTASLLAKLGFQQPGDISRVAQAAACQQRESCSISPSCSADIGSVPYSPLISPSSLAGTDVPSEGWQCCGLPAPCPPRLKGPRARDDLRRHDKKPPLELFSGGFVSRGVSYEDRDHSSCQTRIKMEFSFRRSLNRPSDFQLIPCRGSRRLRSSLWRPR